MHFQTLLSPVDMRKLVGHFCKILAIGYIAVVSFNIAWEITNRFSLLTVCEFSIL